MWILYFGPYFYFVPMELFKHSFEGPHSLVSYFNEVPGVYVITNSLNQVIDVGQTDNLRQRIASHERKPCWQSKNATQMYFAYQASEQIRLALESLMRAEYSPSCGVR